MWLDYTSGAHTQDRRVGFWNPVVVVEDAVEEAVSGSGLSSPVAVLTTGMSMASISVAMYRGWFDLSSQAQSVN